MANEKLEIKWDLPNLWKAINDDPEINVKIQDETIKRRNAANAMAAGFKSGIIHSDSGEEIGNTEAKYASNVRKMGQYRRPVGMVYTANYAAKLENSKNNTLLKVL